MTLNEHCKPGEVLRGPQVRQKKASLEPAVIEKGWTLLWKCKSCGSYWESSFEGRYDELEYLTCLSDEEVEAKWKGTRPRA